ncbi:MAG TPA: thiosulfate oxidation carrier protein SoxY [Geminicoccaceae bacterium]
MARSGGLPKADEAGRLHHVSRRGFARSAGAGVAAGLTWMCLRRPAAADKLQEALEQVLDGRASTRSDRVWIELPERFDYGNTVPFAVTVDSPMSASDYVQQVDVLAEGNPFAEVGTFHFSPESGRASVATRIRLNQGVREVLAVAERSDASVAVARRSVRVAVSGCSSEAGVSGDYVMPTPKPRLKVPAPVARGAIIEIKTMISHRMETGLDTDTEGHPVPRRIINRMTCARDGRLIFAADLSPAIAANAYLTFCVVARTTGSLAFTWHEDGGAVYRATHPLAVV